MWSWLLFLIHSIVKSELRIITTCLKYYNLRMYFRFYKKAWQFSSELLVATTCVFSSIVEWKAFVFITTVALTANHDEFEW